MSNITLQDIAYARAQLKKYHKLSVLGNASLLVPVIANFVVYRFAESDAARIVMLVVWGVFAAVFMALSVPEYVVASKLNVNKMESVWINDRLSEYIKSLGGLSDKEAFRVNSCGNIVEITAEGHPQKERWDLSVLNKRALTFDFEATEWLQYYFYKQLSQGSHFEKITVSRYFDDEEFSEDEVIADGQVTPECLKEIKKMDKKTLAVWD